MEADDMEFWGRGEHREKAGLKLMHINVPCENLPQLDAFVSAGRHEKVAARHEAHGRNVVVVACKREWKSSQVNSAS